MIQVKTNKYRALLSDTFLAIEATSEEEAQQKAKELLIQQLSADDFIVWEE